MLKEGLYESILNNKLNKQIKSQTDKISITAPIDNEEAPKILSKYLAEIIEKELLVIKSNDVNTQIEYVNKIVKLLGDDDSNVDSRGEQLMALINTQNKIVSLDKKAEIIRPVTSLSQSSLFTGAVHEPSMFTELKREILSSDRIDMLVSFIKWSGLRLIIDELQKFTANGGQLRIITTSYMGATDVKAVEELRQLQNTSIKISYDTKRTRLHAKAYIFYRNTGFTTSYVGSSNLSNAAISSGLEWNVKVTAKDLPETISKIDATFESYWNSDEFSDYNETEKPRLEQALSSEKTSSITGTGYNFDINPYPYQQEILDKLEAERIVRGHYRNLIVAATGTGKTVISAFDYKNFCLQNKGKANRFLFVAHREEILKQSIDCFRGVLKDQNFGELFVGGYKPNSIDHLFISVQTFNSQAFQSITTKDFYDYIIVDEFHHAAAPTYNRLLTYYTPQILLGLTATPERMDGEDITSYFDNRIAAEIRLPEAIDRKLLCPFQYFGVSDNVDLNSLSWARGGYEKSALSKLYTGNDIRVSLIVKQLYKYITAIDDVKGIGFCVSKEHAEYMAMQFNKYDISSIYLTADSKDDERKNAKKLLVDGQIRFIFVVDLYNEGVDIPEINTILFLRPTESLTIFLQQLGRGLRLAKDKECLTVLDFIGLANKKYNFENKFKALLESSTKSVQREIKDGFLSLPKGCYIQLEKKAQEYILENIKNSFGTKNALINKMTSFTEDTQESLTLSNFLEYYHLDIRSIYSKFSFSRLKVMAGIVDDFQEDLEAKITKAFSRICSIDSRRWIKYLLDNLPHIEDLTPNEEEYRMLNMLQFTIFQSKEDDLLKSLSRLKQNPILFKELMEILEYNYSKIDFIDEKVPLGFACPLDLHCNYTRDQILVAMDFFNTSSMREGVKYIPDKKLHVLFVTLNKSDKDYSPTTMYNDYSINSTLFHWQSQSSTSPDSPTGQKYINHKQLEDKILLFVREFKVDKAGTAPYTFLGLCDFIKTEGSKPMNITWHLEKPIPARYIKKTNKMIIG